MTTSLGSVDSLAIMSVGAACTATQVTIRLLLVLWVVRGPAPTLVVPATVRGAACLLVGVVASGSQTTPRLEFTG